MSAETRLVGATIVTQDAANTIIADGELAFDASGVITYVGPTRGPAGSGDRDLSGQILLPGLVNAHTHSAMTLMRGSCDDSDLATWLGVVQSLEQHLTPQDVAAGLRLAMVEMIRTGTTTFADMYHWDAALLGEVVSAGMRVVAAHSFFDFADVGFSIVSPMDGRQALDHTEALAGEFAGEKLVRVRYGPHAPYTSSFEMLTEVARRAEKHGLGIQIHLAESAFEVEQNLTNYGTTPILHADKAGLFSVPTLVAHVVHPTEEEIQLLAARGAGVSHNPVSNLKLGSGIAPLPALQQAGVLLGLGTDGAASNNDLDLFEEIKTGSLIHRGVAQQPDITAGTDLLRMATATGAAAVGFPEVGVLEPGRWADVIALQTTTSRATPMFSPTAFLSFAARGSDVSDVFIGGQAVMEAGRLTTLDETAVREEAAAAAARLQSLASSAGEN